MHAPADARAASASRPSESAPARNDGAGAPPSPAIRFSHVSFSYTSAANPRKRRRLRLFGRKGRRADGPRAQAAPLALDDATFDVPAGSVTALIGHTGAGKSTAIELACALKVPATGTVIVNGIDTADLDQRRRLRASVGYVSQLPERQLFGQTVYDDVAFGPRNLKLDEDEVRTRVLDALSQLGLDPEPELLERSPFALSGGQQRAVALAGIVAMRQPILVLDEPMAGLDPAGRNRMRALFMQLKAAGTTLLLVTHSMDDAAQLADRVVVLSHGRVTDEGSPEAVFGRAARSRATGVPGLPAPMRFQQELARHGIVPTDPALTIDALADQVAASVPNLGERPPLTARKRARAMAEAR